MSQRGNGKGTRQVTTYYRKTYDIAGYTFNADCYCRDCGESLPDIDPEGNAKHPVFLGDLLDIYHWWCYLCGVPCSEW